jgi:hypothetical protein
MQHFWRSLASKEEDMIRRKKVQGVMRSSRAAGWPVVELLIRMPSSEDEAAQARNGTERIAFQLDRTPFDLATNTQTNWQVVLQRNLTLTFFIPGSSDAVNVTVADYPLDRWTIACTADGRLLPFAVLRRRGGYLGAWLPITHESLPASKPLTPAEQREKSENYALAMRLSSMQHQNAMQNIRLIR